MPLKMKEIAKRLGVSPATVSLAIHNRPGISEATRKRVFAALEEHGRSDLIPSAEPKELRNIRLVLYRNGAEILTDTPFFLKLIEGIDEKAKETGFNMMISYLNAADCSPEALEILKEGDCCGLLLLATEMTAKEIAPFQQLGLPLVALDGNFEDAGVSCVAIGNTASMETAVEHLIGLGHARIGYLKSNRKIRNFTERFEGYRQTMARHGLPILKGFVLETPPTAEGAYHAVKECLARDGLCCTAFAADNDNILFGAVRALKEYHIPVPDRVSVTGFDDIPLAEISDPPLTSLRVPKQTMGRIALSLLATLIDETPEAPIKITVGTQLIVRKSTGIPAL